jgi:glycosyltransferase involved in cell wall biosynthesis
MRIAFVINDLSGGGAEKALQLLTAYLAGEGCEVRVITLERVHGGYQLDRAVSHVELRKAAARRGPARILAMPLQAAQLAREFREWNPDVCVSFLPRSNIAHVMTRWFGNRRAILLTEQISSADNYPSGGVADRSMRALIGRFYPRADAVFPSSHGVAEGLTSFGVRRDRMHVIGNPVSLGDIAHAARQPLPEMDAVGQPTVITVGRHVEQKDHGTLLRAFARVLKRRQARLVIIGQGPLRADMERLAAELGIRDAVVFAGWQTNPFAWLSRACVFVLSSRYEGFGNVIVEAMACSLPVISTDCRSGPAEILEDGAAGILVPVGDDGALAEAITTLLEDDAVRHHFVAQSRRRAPQFDISVVGPAYRDLLASYAGRS